MPAFPHPVPATDPTTAVLLAEDDLTTRLTLLALEAVGDPVATSRVLNLLEDLSALVGMCEEAVGLTVPFRLPEIAPLNYQQVRTD